MTTENTLPILHDYDQARVIERPDGFYWQDEELADKFFGPFPTLLEAVQDMLLESDSDTDFEVGESLEDVEAEIGISNWIDPETGEPAEDSSTRINDDI
ncbi:MAG: hypothetical protein WA635_05790 [Gallionella sp.]